jgi:hypothetical protein
MSSPCSVGRWKGLVRAISLAEKVGDTETLTNTLNVKAHLIFSRGDPAGMALMEESYRRAKEAGDHWGEVKALSNMAGMCGDVRQASLPDKPRHSISSPGALQIRRSRTSCSSPTEPWATMCRPS